MTFNPAKPQLSIIHWKISNSIFCFAIFSLLYIDRKRHQRFTWTCNCVKRCCFCLSTSSLARPQFQRQPQSIISIMFIAAVRRWFGNWNFNLKLSYRHSSSVWSSGNIASCSKLQTQPSYTPTRPLADLAIVLGAALLPRVAVACNAIPSDVALMIAISEVVRLLHLHHYWELLLLLIIHWITSGPPSLLPMPLRQEILGKLIHYANLF